MLNGLKHHEEGRQSYWSHNVLKLFELFINKGSPTKYCFQVFQYFFNEFTASIDEPYIIAGLRALASHHTLLLANSKLWYHTIKGPGNKDIKLTWKMLFNEFRTNLQCYINGSMFIKCCCCKFSKYICLILL